MQSKFQSMCEILGTLKSWRLKLFRSQSVDDPVREAIEDLIEDSESDATLLEAEELKEKIFRMEHDLWSY